MKFKRLNISGYSVRKGVNYYSVDLLRQTSVKEFVEMLSREGHSAEQIKKIVLNNVKVLLDEMIFDK